jgi:hypothetical protein
MIGGVNKVISEQSNRGRRTIGPACSSASGTTVLRVAALKACFFELGALTLASFSYHVNLVLELQTGGVLGGISLKKGLIALVVLWRLCLVRQYAKRDDAQK